MMILEYIAHLFTFIMITVGVHEYFHLAVLRLLGGDGYIRLTWWGGYVVIEVMPEHHLWLVYLSGGFLTAVIFFILGMWFENELEERAAALPHFLSQLGYGVCEVLLLPLLGVEHFIIISGIITSALFVVGAVIGIFHWLLRPKTFY